MATASPPTTAAGVTCPACHAQVPAGSQFCNTCGTKMGTAAAPASPAAPSSAAPIRPAATSSMPTGDIRERVDQDRGFLKRLQLLLPGFRGYRQGEDIREADSFLRLQIADKVHRAVAVVQDCRQSLTQAGQFQSLTDFSALLSELQQLEGSIRHAEQGYTGISPAVRIAPDRLDKLYEYDYGFAQAADQMTAALGPLRDAASGTNPAAVAQAVVTVRGQIRQLDGAFRARLRAVEGINV